MMFDPSDLAHRFERIRENHLPGPTLRDMHADNADRQAELTLNAGDLSVDFSKTHLTPALLEDLVALAEEAGMPDRRDAMFSGEHINITEDRAVVHTALRLPKDAELVVDGVDVVTAVHDVLDRAAEFCERVRNGQHTGTTGARIRRVVSIGIGGSDLGPVMATRAMRPWVTDDIDFRFVSNVDPVHLHIAIEGADPAETLFIVVSKTFTTLETITNATVARDWLVAALGESAVRDHFVAVSTNAREVAAFGIDTDNMFGFWDWVGGRYSVGSAVGLAVMLAVGPERFTDFLAGFHTIDEHFRSTPLEENVPALLGLVGMWHHNVCGYPTLAVVPYAQDLDRFPAYLQQLDMESNGKRVNLSGEPLTFESGPVLWGEPGTNGQHAFFQLLHQGTSVVPVEFIGFRRAGCPDPADQQSLLLANMMAQADALAFGKTTDEVEADGVAADLVAARTFPGNRPSVTTLADRLTPGVLGQLIAVHEHRVFTQGSVWGINSFDQWGVELGKALAGPIVERLRSTR
jgi:glucose-6-phosphate isomerase